MVYNTINDIKNLSDKEMIDFLKRYWKTYSFSFYGEFLPEQRVASFYCGYIKHVKVPGSSILMTYPFIRKAVEFKVPARFRIKGKGFYKFSCTLAPINERLNANNYCQIKLDFESLIAINEMTYNGKLLTTNHARHSMTKEEKRLFQELHERKQNDLETFMDEDYEGFWESVVSKYPESAHFVYELLQNADDAQATSAKFILRKDGLIFVHNGTRHFNITDRKDKSVKLGDINAIVNIGHNAKNGVNTIGKFGVGFKSVFQYTEAPEIYDDTFKFRIDNYIVPTLLNHDFRGREDGQTLFFIPFKDKEKGYSYIKARLNSLKSPILFLRNLKEIKWKEDSEDSFHDYTKSERQILHDEKHNIECSLINERNNEEENNIYMFSRNVSIESNTYHIYVGFYLKEDGSLDTKTKRKVFCFFQTSVSFGMPFISHAPFLTTDNRDGLLPDSDVNQTFIEELAKLAADSMLLLRDIGVENDKPLLTSNLFDIIPVEYANPQYIKGQTVRGETLDISIFYKLFTQKVKSEDIIYTNSGDYLSIYDVLRSDIKIRSIVTKEQLNLLLKDGEQPLNATASTLQTIVVQMRNKDFIRGSFDYNIREYQINVLGIQEFTNTMFAKGLTSEFMDAQSDEWVEKLYNYIKKADVAKEFLHSPIIKTQKGEWKAPQDEDDNELVYLPLFSNDNNVNAPYDFVSMASYIKYREFFVYTLHMSQPNIIDFIRTTIVPHYHEGNKIEDDTATTDFISLIHIYFDFKKDMNNREWEWDTNSDNREFNGITIDDLTELIAKQIKFKAVDGIYYCSEELYEGNDDLRQYFKGDDSLHEFDFDFYTKGNDEWNKDEIKTFIHAININTNHPCIKCIEYQVDTKIVHNYRIESFWGSTKSAVNSKIMWNNIIKDSGNFFKYQPYRYTYTRNYTKELGITDIFKQLAQSKWIYNSLGQLCNPEDLTIEEFHSLGYKPNVKIESYLDFGRKAREEQEKKATEAAQQQVLDNNEIVDLYGGNLEDAKRAKILLDEFNGTSEGEFEEELNEFREWRKNKDKYAYIGNTVDIDYNSGIDFEESLDIPTGLDFDEPSSKTLVRKTLHYLGIKLYEGLLKKENHQYQRLEKTEGEKNGYDIKVMPNKLVKISVVNDKEIDRNKFAPIGITKMQHKYMNASNTNRYTIIRIALKDLEINFDRDIRDIYGAEADIDEDSHLKAKCDKLVENYWSSKTSDDFKKMTSEYSIQIFREL